MPEDQPGPWGDIRYVSHNFHQAMRLPLVRGRYFTPQDGPGAPRVVIVDEEMVRRYWPNTDPIGKRITRGDPDAPATQWLEVVGVVGHAMHEGLDADARVQLYYPYRQGGLGSMTFAVRTSGRPHLLARRIRQTVYSVDDDQPIAQVRTMDELIADSVGGRKLSTVLLGVFAGLALLLGSLGIYGVMSNLVTQRTQEMGVRMALGAMPRDLLGLVLRDGLVLIGIGVVAGILGSLALTRLIQNQLFGVRATDPVNFVVVVLILAAAALLAVCIPAYRATRLDPVLALRTE